MNIKAITLLTTLLCGAVCFQTHASQNVKNAEEALGTEGQRLFSKLPQASKGVQPKPGDPGADFRDLEAEEVKALEDQKRLAQGQIVFLEYKLGALQKDFKKSEEKINQFIKSHFKKLKKFIVQCNASQRLLQFEKSEYLSIFAYMSQSGPIKNKHGARVQSLEPLSRQKELIIQSYECSRRKQGVPRAVEQVQRYEKFFKNAFSQINSAMNNINAQCYQKIQAYYRFYNGNQEPSELEEKQHKKLQEYQDLINKKNNIIKSFDENKSLLNKFTKIKKNTMQKINDLEDHGIQQTNH